MLKIFLWLRYLQTKKIVLLSIAAVAVSVALMVTADSLFTGYINALDKMVFSDMGDAVLWSYHSSPIGNYEQFIDKLEEHPNIETAAPYHYGAGLLYIEGADVREVIIKGINPKYENEFRNWNQNLLRQKNTKSIPDFSVPDKPGDLGVWLGINIIAEPNEDTDEYDLEYAKNFIARQVVLTTIGYGKTRRVEKLRVSDVASSKGYFDDKTLYMPIQKLRQIDTGMEDNNANFIKLKLADKANLQQMTRDIQDIWNDYAVNQMGLEPKTVPALNVEMRERLYQNIFEDLRNQLAVVLLIFGVICSVAVLLIFCIFYMIVMARQKDIAIIKSCGASSISAASIFGGFGACVGIIGAAVGVLGGIIITRNVNVLEEWARVIFGIKFWRTSSYGLAEIPHQVNWPTVPPIVIAAIAGCVIGVLIPAIIAARTNPVKILRYE